MQQCSYFFMVGILSMPTHSKLKFEIYYLYVEEDTKFFCILIVRNGHGLSTSENKINIQCKIVYCLRDLFVNSMKLVCGSRSCPNLCLFSYLQIQKSTSVFKHVFIPFDIDVLNKSIIQREKMVKIHQNKNIMLYFLFFKPQFLFLDIST